MLDLSLYLMGNPKPVSVYGSTYAEFGPKRKGIGTWGTLDWSGFYNVEDLASAMIKMEDGSTLTLEVSWITSVMTGYTNNLILEAIYESSGPYKKLSWIG
ncbi:oxidoreductase domain protein [Paenibacillus larvae subsp. larvae DSM 25430]|uniref:Oxidoreductase domain protein n=1 Tax=Paenibacillus larvae subsp. larvae DSM 25430 TaxID=697284 RepID=V9W5B7_9BACL|nr:oxidoreductase domain protein [Paenibacillus larvae subsp. larvae DSM 25430]